MSMDAITEKMGGLSVQSSAKVSPYQPAEYDRVVIYHGGCADGTAAAWPFAKAYPGTTYLHAAYERNFYKDPKMPDLSGKIVYIVDWSYPRDVLADIRKRAERVTVLDHHKTTKEELATPVEGINTTIDMDRCGAEIAWDHLHPVGSPARPWYLTHIADRDLWKWTHPDSKAFSAALQERGITLDTFESLYTMDLAQQQEFIARGKKILDITEYEVKAICAASQLVTFVAGDKEYRAYAVNSFRYRSEVGNELALRPDCDFAMMYSHDPIKARWEVSLRGIKDKNIDLSAIAKMYGGGGHPLACGFTYTDDISDIIRKPRDNE